MLPGYDQGDQSMPVTQADAPDPSGRATHGPDSVFREANRLALTGQQHHVTITVGNRRPNQPVALFQFQCPQANAALPGKLTHIRFLDEAPGGRHENIVSFFIPFDGQDRGNSLALIKGQQVDHGTAPGVSAGQRNVKDPQPVDLAQVRKTQNGRVGTGNQQMLYEIFILDRSGGPAGATPALGLIIRQRLGFGITAMGDSHHPVFLGNQVLHLQVMGRVSDFRQAIISEFLYQFPQLLTNHLS